MRNGIAARALHLGDAGQWEALAFVTWRQLRLRENFTGFTTDLRSDGGPQRGDGVEQSYRVTTVGSRGAYRTPGEGGWFRGGELGYSLRHDAGESRQRRLRTLDGVPYRVDLDSGLGITNLGVYAATRVSPWRRLILSGGLRLDTYVFAVEDRNRPATDRTGRRETSDQVEAFGYAFQPKLGAELRLLGALRAVVSAGVGTRSSDPQALSDGEFAPFARVRATEAGLAWTGRAGPTALDARLMGYLTRVDRDLLFDETVGRNTLAGTSNRFGATASVRATAAPRFDLLASATYAEAYLPDPDAAWYQLTAGRRMPYIPRWVVRGDGAYQQPLPWTPVGARCWLSAAAGVTYVAPRPLPYEQTSPPLATLDASVRAGIGPVELAAEVTNLLDRRNREAVYNYTSNFRGPDQPPSLLVQHHFSAGAPRMVMLTLSYRHASRQRGEVSDAAN